jgi:carboxyl-terminal processing protease
LLSCLIEKERYFHMANSGANKTHLPGKYRYLPLLSGLLVILSLGLVIKILLDRPSGELEKRVASFRSALQLVTENYVREVDQEALYRAAMDGMVDSLKDPYSTYLDSFGLRSTNIQAEGEFGGIGVIVAPHDNGGIVVDVWDGTPAARAAIAPGDVLLEVDGEKVSAMKFVEMVSRVRGPVGSSVVLTLEDAETGDKKDVELIRESIEIPTVVWERVDDAIGSIAVRQFNARCVEIVKDAIGVMQEEFSVKGLIIDLRGNTGGLMRQAIDLADMFLSGGRVVRVESRVAWEQEAFDADKDVVIEEDMPIVIMVDERTASAAELFAGALQSHGRAVLVGTRTFGKGAVDRVFMLPDGTGIMLTVAEFKPGNDVSVAQNGLVPEHIVGELPDPPAEGDLGVRKEWLQKYRAAKELQYEKAIEILRQKIAE